MHAMCVKILTLVARESSVPFRDGRPRALYNMREMLKVRVVTPSLPHSLAHSLAR